MPILIYICNELNCLLILCIHVYQLGSNSKHWHPGTAITCWSLLPETLHKSILKCIFHMFPTFSSSPSLLPQGSTLLHHSCSSFLLCCSSSIFCPYCLLLYHISGFPTTLVGWQGDIFLTEKAFSHFFTAFASLSSGNGRVHKCQWGGGIPQSIIGMNAHTHTLFHSQMHTKIRPHIQKCWCRNASTKTDTHAYAHAHTRGKKLHRNIRRMPIHLSSCFTEFLHNAMEAILSDSSECVCDWKK